MPPNPASKVSSNRLKAISSHLPPPASLKMATKDPITCHVLDTTTGRPAPRMIVTLTSNPSSSSPSSTFTAVTNTDGRITNWDAEVGSGTIEALIKEGASRVWQLRFNTGAYYGEGKTFWPWVELTFFVKEGEHYHVPLLLGPYSYTTYRGS